MSRALPWSLLIIAVLTAGPVYADLMLQRRVEADAFSSPKRIGGGSSECPVAVPDLQTGDVVQLWAGAQQARRDQPGVSVTLDSKKDKLHFLFHGEKKFSSINFPFKQKEGSQSAFYESMGEDVEALLAFQVHETTRAEQQIQGLTATVFGASVASVLKGRFRVAVTVTTARESNTFLIGELEGALNDLRFNGHGWWATVVESPGLPLQIEENRQLPATEVAYREVLVSIEELAATPGLYDIPADYARIAFDARCMAIR